MTTSIKLQQPTIWLMLTTIIFLILINTTKTEEESSPRQKRILWFKSDGKLALPLGTTLTILSSLDFPLMLGETKNGFNVGFGITMPIKIDFGKLGFTDKMNPFGNLPPKLMHTHMVMSRGAKNMGVAATNMLSEYVSNMIDHSRNKRAISEKPELPTEYADAFHAGERAILYLTVQEFLEKFGLNGKGCLLRAMCEVHAHPLHQFGFIGEMVKLFLTASKSSYSHLLEEYVAAENTGSGKSGPAECWPYYRNCTTSLFVQNHNKYSEHHDHTGNEINLDQHNKYSKPINNVQFDKHNKYSKYHHHKNDLVINDIHHNRLEKRDVYNDADIFNM